MFEKIGRVAEKMADGVSRRAFLGRFGKAALATAGVLGAVLAFPGVAQAGKCGCAYGGICVCWWLCNGVAVYTRYRSFSKNPCQSPAKGCTFQTTGCV